MPLRGVGSHALLVFGVTHPADIAVGPDEAEGSARDRSGGREMMEVDVFAPGWDGTITVQLPVKCRQRGVVILVLQPGKAVAALEAMKAAGAQGAIRIVNAGLRYKPEGRTAYRR